MVDPTKGKQVLGVPIAPVTEANPLRATMRSSMSESRDEPRSGRLSKDELDVLLMHLQGVEERYAEALKARDERISEIENELRELHERTTKIPSTPPGNVDISKGPQGVRVRGPAGYALAIAALLFAAAVLFGAKPVVSEVIRQLTK